MSRRWFYLLVLLSFWSETTWAANAYKTFWLNTYCAPTATCSVYWPADETAGPTIANQCGLTCGLAPASDFNMTAFNTPTFNQAGVNASRGTSILFDSASSEYGEAHANGSGTGPGDYDDFTTGCWAKIDTSVGNQTMLSTNLVAFTAADNRIWSISVAGTPKKLVWGMFQKVVDGNGVHQSVTGATTITTNTWYFYVVTFKLSTTTSTVFLNGVSDGTSSTTSGSTPNAVEYFDMATRSSNPTQFMTGYAQDCFVVKRLLDPATAYCVGVGTCNTDDWPYNVKIPAPDLPKYVMGDYGKRLIDYGYTTGNWVGKVKRPRLFGPYVTFAAQMPGDFGWRK